MSASHTMYVKEVAHTASFMSSGETSFTYRDLELSSAICSWRDSVGMRFRYKCEAVVDQINRDFDSLWRKCEGFAKLGNEDIKPYESRQNEIESLRIK